MAKAPRLGDWHRYLPRWWHHIEPKTVAIENFQPKVEPSRDEQDDLRFEQFAEIALHESRPRTKRTKKAA